MFYQCLAFLIISYTGLAIPVEELPSANFKVGVPLYTKYQDHINGAKFGAVTVDVNLSMSKADLQGRRDFTWTTFQHPQQAAGEIGEPIWNMSCSATAKAGFDGVAEFTLKDEYPWITAGVNATGVRDGTSGKQCPTGQCLSQLCEGQELPVIDTFLHSY
ncbi:hypothetical protein I302_107507 [Kwoniella bestiolae CBS 10118]|uniref:Uncharacterized protein n=1 Tax=Kwoniella bestiolae CBS 10118 TaxID=1296100 RepID=A0A1B9FYB1_9TREE|nr:hypothetical protein I302_06752 [Kwoniella bestiolae CBS 10118]OCF23768.1 hypothetical protein I302_06752 [Kwoniella bestiolae CBS 10118]